MLSFNYSKPTLLLYEQQWLATMNATDIQRVTVIHIYTHVAELLNISMSDGSHLSIRHKSNLCP